MKPRHTGEQSTVSVNKSETLGLKGFSFMRQKETTIVEDEKISLDMESPSPMQKFKSAVYDTEGNMIACPIDPSERNQCDSCQ